MASVSCPSCGARLAKGVLRCRFCGADARHATSAFLAAHASLAELVREQPVPGAPRRIGPRRPARDADELLAASRDLFFGP
jgi:hypothetical protein